MQIALIPAAASQKPALANLIQLSRYDLSECNSADVDEQGYFSYSQIDAYWTEAGYHPFLIRTAGRLAGFALVNRHSRLRRSFDGHTVVAFFVLHQLRRQGIGRTAAMSLFDRFPGSWEVAACAQNVPGHVFWRCVVDHYTGGRYAETWLETAGWRGPVQSFVAPATPRLR